MIEFIFPDGNTTIIEEYQGSHMVTNQNKAMIRGLSRGGSRPIKAKVTPDIDKESFRTVYYALDPDHNNNIEYLYEI